MSSRSSLNHIYRTVWNQALGAMVAVAEISVGRGRSTGASRRSRLGIAAQSFAINSLTALSVGIAIGWAGFVAQASANPNGGVAIQGQASMVSQGKQLTVTTQNGPGTNHSAINWQSFSIPAGNTTYFQQPNTLSTVINRVVTQTPSLIFGTLGSNGSVVLVNQSGIAVGAGAVVDTAGFTASTLRMSDADALAGRLRFGDGSGPAGISVQGSILARSGDVVLLGSSVDTGQNALIQAPNGATILGAGSAVSIRARGLDGINFEVQAPLDSAVNLGTLKGDAVGIFAGTLKHSGTIQATQASLDGGKVVLKAAGDAYVQGNGRIEATSATSQGGRIEVLGKRVAVTDRTVLDASGASGGGTVLVGGDYQGRNAAVPNAQNTYLGKDASVKADATAAGKGGRVIVWADDTTRAFGHISAKGGELGGDGGFVEVSGKGVLDFQALVDTRAPKGNSGQLLLDPTNIYIADTNANAQLAGMGGSADNATGTAGTPFVFDAPGISSQPADSLLLVSALETALASNNVEVTTSSGRLGAGDIVVASNFTKSAGGPATLKLIATNDVIVKTGVEIRSASGALGVVLNADSDASGGGAIVMESGSKIDSNGGNITLGGGGNPSTIAATGNSTNKDGIKLTNAKLLAGAGSIRLSGTGVANVASYNSGIQIDSGSEIRTTSGSITLVGLGGSGGSTESDKKGVQANGSTLASTSGAISITGTGGPSLSTSVNVGLDLTGNTIESNTGNVTLVGTGGAAGTNNNYGVYLEGGVVRSNVNSAVSITGNGPASPAVGGTGNTGVKMRGGSLGSGLTVSAVAGSVAINGTGTFTGTGGSGPEGIYVEGNTGNPVNIRSTGAASITLTGAGAGNPSGVAISLDGFSAPVTVGGASASGAINLIAGGAKQDINFASGVTIQSTGVLTMKTVATSTSMHVGAGGSSPDFQLTPTGIGSLANGFSEIIIGESGITGALTVGTGTVFTDSLTLNADGITVEGTLQSSGNTVKLNAGSDGVSDNSSTGSITASNLLVNSVGGVSLTGSNSVSTLSSTLTGAGSSLSFKNAAALSLGAISTSGDLLIETTNGAISQTAALIANGSGKTATLTSGTGTVTLSNTANDFTAIAVSGTTGAVIVNDVNAVDLGTIGAGAFRVGAGGAITTSGVVTTSAGAIEIGTSSGAISVGAGLSATGGNVKIKAANGLSLNTAAGISSNASGDAVILIADAGIFNANTTPVSAPNGRGLVYLKDPGGHTFPGTPGFKQYNTAYGATVQQSTGNGVIYNNTTPAKLTATLTGAVSKVFDGALGIPLSGASVGAISGGLIDGDTGGTLTIPAGAFGNLTTANVGTGKPVVATGLAVSGLVGGAGISTVYGYQIEATGNIGAVTPAITSIGLSGSRVYDGTNIVNASIFSLSGLVGSDTLTISGSGTVADKNVGVNKVVSLGSLKLGNGTGLASNYTFAGGQHVATITPAPITNVTGISAANKVYDGNVTAVLNTSAAVMTGMVAGDALTVASVTGAFANKNAGTGKTVNISDIVLGGADAGNYKLGSSIGSTTANIAPATISAVTGVVAANKVYDGSAAATLNSGAAGFTGMVSGDALTVASASGVFVDKNAGAGKKVNISGFTLGGSDALNYTLGSSTAATTANITPATISAVTGITAENKIYDGTVTATLNLAKAGFTGMVSGDVLTVASASGAFADKNAGTGKIVNVNGILLGGTDALNYTLGSTTSSATAEIARRPLAKWIGPSNGVWSAATNWDAIPDGSNVLAISIPEGSTVVHDAAAGNTTLGSIVSAGTLGLSGGTLSVAGSITTPQYSQSGGAFKGAGDLNVTSQFSQTGGTAAVGGAVTVTQSSGNLTMSGVSAAAVQLSAANGNIDFTNVGAIDVQGINAANGNVTVNNTGGISTSGLVIAPNGTVSMTANSPLTIGAAGVRAGGNISLTATNLTSAGKLTLNGPVVSKTGSVTLTSAGDFLQNALVSAATGISAAAQGPMTFGPLATTDGSPVIYEINGVKGPQPVSARLPPLKVLELSEIVAGSLASDLSRMDEILIEKHADDAAPKKLKNDLGTDDGDPKNRKKSKDDIVVEGEVCSR